METVYFYTKENCSLCQEGLLLLKNLQRTYSFHIEERDIYTKDEWLEKYQIRIPVVEDKTGKLLDEGILSVETLSAALRSLS